MDGWMFNFKSSIFYQYILCTYKHYNLETLIKSDGPTHILL